MVFEDFTTKDTKRRRRVPCKIASIGGGPDEVVVWIDETDWPATAFTPFRGLPPLRPRVANLLLTRDDAIAFRDMLNARLEQP